MDTKDNLFKTVVQGMTSIGNLWLKNHNIYNNKILANIPDWPFLRFKNYKKKDSNFKKRGSGRVKWNWV